MKGPALQGTNSNYWENVTSYLLQTGHITNSSVFKLSIAAHKEASSNITFSLYRSRIFLSDDKRKLHLYKVATTNMLVHKVRSKSTTPANYYDSKKSSTGSHSQDMHLHKIVHWGKTNQPIIEKLRMIWIDWRKQSQRGFVPFAKNITIFVCKLCQNQLSEDEQVVTRFSCNVY